MGLVLIWWEVEGGWMEEVVDLEVVRLGQVEVRRELEEEILVV